MRYRKCIKNLAIYYTVWQKIIFSLSMSHTSKIFCAKHDAVDRICVASASGFWINCGEIDQKIPQFTVILQFTKNPDVLLKLWWQHCVQREKIFEVVLGTLKRKKVVFCWKWFSIELINLTIQKNSNITWNKSYKHGVKFTKALELYL